MVIEKTDVKKEDAAKLDLYRQIGIGYQAMLDGKEKSLGQVKKEIQDRRNSRG